MFFIDIQFIILYYKFFLEKVLCAIEKVVLLQPQTTGGRVGTAGGRLRSSLIA